jgi:hypothetical protein
LWPIINDLAALCRLVLNAPLADFLAKGKAGELAATSNAICHGFLREYQQRREKSLRQAQGRLRAPSDSGPTRHLLIDIDVSRADNETPIVPTATIPLKPQTPVNSSLRRLM